MISRPGLVTLLLVLLLVQPALDPPHAAAATQVGGVLAADTTWTVANSPYEITQTVQIPSGRTLTIEPGVEVVSRVGWSDMFLVHGGVRAHGTNEARIVFDGGGSSNFFSVRSSPATAFVDVSYADIRNGSSLWWDGPGHMHLRNSEVRDVRSYSYLWYPGQDIYIEYNTFINSAGFSIGHDGPSVYIRWNRFVSRTGSAWWVQNWAAYSGQTIVQYNSFENVGQLAVMLPGDYRGAKLLATENYWGTTDRAVIESMISDNNDDITAAGAIPYEPFLAGPDPRTPRATVPEAPLDVSAVAGDRSAQVTWAPPASDGASPIISYTVHAYEGSSSVATITAASTARSAIISGLTNGTSYTFTVVATNTAGSGPASAASSPVVPLSPPGAPTAVTAAVGNGQATVTWAAPTSDGGSPITRYTATAAPGEQTCTTTGALACTVSGLTNGTSYTFTVVATNGVGSGPASAASAPVVPTDGLGFHSQNPARILDSRPPPNQVGPFGSPWVPGQTRDVMVVGRGGVPADAAAVTLNVTVTATTAGGFLTVWPAGQPRPLTSSLNWAPGQTIPNAVTVKVGSGGAISVFNQTGDAHVIIDVVGYYRASSGNGFASLSPARISDSRPAASVGSYSTPWGAGTIRDVPVAGLGGIPADADAVVVNVTVTSTTAGGYLTIWPAGQTQPSTSSLNWSPGQTIPNAVTVKVGAGGKLSVFNAVGDAHVIIDVVGSFSPGTGDLFHSLSPARIQDSRPAGPQVGPYSTPWGAGMSRDVQGTGASGVPAGAAAVLMNVTVTGTTAASYLTVWPAGEAAPLASSLNWALGDTIPNSVTAKLGATGGVSIKNAVGEAHVIADVAGWYG